MENVELNPRQPDAYDLLDQAQEFAARGESDEAVELCRRATAISPGDCDVWLQFGAIAEGLGLLVLAKFATQRAVELDPTDLYNWLHHGHSLYALQEYREALLAYRRATVGNSETSIRAWCGLAGTHLDLGETEPGKEALNRALEASVADSGGRQIVRELAGYIAQTLLDRAELCLESENEERALELGRLATEIDGDDFYTWYRFGAIARESGEFETARYAMTRTTEIEPSHTDGWYGLANAHRSLDLLHEAVDLYRHSLLLEPKHSSAMNNLGLTLNDLGEFGEAMIVLEQGLSDHPDDFELLYNLGNSLFGLGDYEAAVDQYEHALRVDSSDLWLWDRYVECLDKCGRHEQAREAEVKALEIEERLDGPSAGF